MLLVMETTGLFNQNNPDIKFSQLCSITKDRIESFLPGLWEDLFKPNVVQPPIVSSSAPVPLIAQPQENLSLAQISQPTAVSLTANEQNNSKSEPESNSDLPVKVN